MAPPLWHGTVILLGAWVFLVNVLAFTAEGQVTGQHNKLNNHGSLDDHELLDILDDIHISDVNFKFDVEVKEYKVITDGCIHHLEMFFQIPTWMKPIPQEKRIDTEESVNGNPDSSLGLAKKVDIDPVNNGTDDHDNHKNNATDDKVNDVNDSTEHFGKTTSIDGKPEEHGNQIDISVNGQTVDRRNYGYVKIPVRCGMKNRINIDIGVWDGNEVKIMHYYKVDVEVPSEGDKNYLVTLEVTDADGTSKVLRPPLSRAFRIHSVAIEHEVDTTFSVYAECQHGIPTVNGHSGNSINLRLKQNMRESIVVIDCGDVAGNDGGKLVEATTYTIKLERPSANDVPPPRNIMSLMESNQCEIKQIEEGNTTNITCIREYRRFSPLIVETDPDCLYVTSSDNVVDGYIKELHAFKEGYIQLRNESITPILDLKDDIVIHGISGQKVKTFVIHNKTGSTNGVVYRSILTMLMALAYLAALVTSLLSAMIRAHTGVVFDQVPIIGEPMMYLVQVICAHADERTGKLCQHFAMLPTMSDIGVDYLQILVKFYIYAFFLFVIVSIIAVSKRKSEQSDEDESPRKYIPLDAVVSIFAFPWVYLAFLSVIKPLFGISGELQVEFEFINTSKVKMATPIVISWIDYLRFHSTLPIAILGFVATIRISIGLFNQIFTIWRNIKDKEMLWIWERDPESDIPFNYSYYEEQEPGHIDAFIETLHTPNNKGFWIYRKCHMLSTQFVPTFTSSLLPFTPRKHALVAAYIGMVDLDERYEALGNDSHPMYFQDYDPLNGTTSSVDIDVPEVVDVYPADDVTMQTVRLRVPPARDREEEITRMPLGTITGVSSKGLNAETPIYLQVDYIKRISRRFETKVLATVETRFITYFVTYRLIKNAYRFNHDMDFKGTVKMRTILQAKLGQLFTLEDMKHRELDRNIQVPLLHKVYVASKVLNGLLAAAGLVAGQRTAKWLRYIQIISHIIMALMFIVEKPYGNTLDNWFSFVCMLTGLYYSVYTNMGCGTTQSCFWLSLVMIAIMVYATSVSLMFLVDVIAILWLPSSEMHPLTNVRVVVKDRSTSVVDVIYGRCNQTVSMQCISLNKEHVTIGETSGSGKIPTIAVALEHIDRSSCYLPFITIAYVSDIRDTFVVNRSQANKPFLKRYFSGRFNKKIAHSLARKIVDHVEFNTHYSSFCFEIPA